MARSIMRCFSYAVTYAFLLAAAVDAQVTPQPPLPSLSCKFDSSLCGWKASSDMQFRQTASVGPAGSNSTSQAIISFAFADAQVPSSDGHNLTSPQISLVNATQISFKFILFGRFDQFSLSLHVQEGDRVSNLWDVDQNSNLRPDTWLHVRIPLCRTGMFQLRFAVLYDQMTIQSITSSNRTTLAGLGLDDIVINNESTLLTYEASNFTCVANNSVVEDTISCQLDPVAGAVQALNGIKFCSWIAGSAVGTRSDVMSGSTVDYWPLRPSIPYYRVVPGEGSSLDERTATILSKTIWVNGTSSPGVLSFEYRLRDCQAVVAMTIRGIRLIVTRLSDLSGSALSDYTWTPVSFGLSSGSEYIGDAQFSIDIVFNGTILETSPDSAYFALSRVWYTTEPGFEADILNYDPVSETEKCEMPPGLSDVSGALSDLGGSCRSLDPAWVTEAPAKILSACEQLQNIYAASARGNTSIPTAVPFDNVLVMSTLLRKIVSFDFTQIHRWENQGDLANTTLTIFECIVGLTQRIDGTTATVPLQRPKDLTMAQNAERDLYASLESLPDMLPVSPTKYEFNTPSVSTYVLKIIPRLDETFNDIRENLRNTILVGDLTDSDIFTNSTYNLMGSEEVKAEGNTTANLQLDLKILERLFNESRDSMPPTVFSVMLAVVERFRFASFDHSTVFAGSKARKVAPLMLMAKLSKPVSETEGIVKYSARPDDLFKTWDGRKFNGVKNYECVYFDYAMHNGNGGWSTKGCRKRSGRSTAIGEEVECECDHLTPFTFFFFLCSTLYDLESLEGPQLMVQFADMEPATIATLSLAVSIVLIFLVLLHMSWRLLKTGLNKRIRSRLAPGIRMNPINFTRLNLVISLLGSNVTLLVAQHVPDTNTESDPTMCLATAVMSHYLMLSSFFWMAGETFFIMKLIYNMQINYLAHDTYDGIRWKVAVVAWGGPVVFPAVSLLSHIDDLSGTFGGRAYGSSTLWCWIDPTQTQFFLGTFVVPVCAMAVVNISILCYCMFVRRTRAAQLEAGRASTIKQGAISVICECLLLGGSWLSGYIMLMFCCNDTLKKVAGGFFILLNGAQGVFLVIWYVKQLDGRHFDELRGLCARRKPVQNPVSAPADAVSTKTSQNARQRIDGGVPKDSKIQETEIDKPEHEPSVITPESKTAQLQLQAYLQRQRPLTRHPGSFVPENTVNVNQPELYLRSSIDRSDIYI